MVRLIEQTPSTVRTRWVPSAPLLVAAVLAVTLALTGAVLGAPPFVQHEFERARTAVATHDPEVLRDYLRSFGPLAPFASVGMMVVQAAIAPIPGFIIVFANGLAFGMVWGTAVSLAGYAVAAAACFYVARRWGRGHFRRLTTRLGLASLDAWVTRSGAKAVFLLRLLPGFSFDGVSYAAGLTGVRFRPFLVASLAGSLPQVLLFVHLGERGQEHLLPMLVAGIAVTVGSTVAHTAWTWRQARQD